MGSGNRELIDRAWTEVGRLFTDHPRPTQPFRNRFQHTLRVLRWAQRICDLQGEGDPDVITLAVLFHDVGWEEGATHEEVSGAIARRWLSEQGAGTALVKAVVDAAANHNQRHLSPVSIEEQIVMDADLLDETGALGFAFDAMSVATSLDPGYPQLLERSRQHYQRVAQDLQRIRTAAGRQLLEARLAVYRSCLEELGHELEAAAP